MRTILQWYQSGGPFIVPLLLVGGAGIALLIERIVYIVLRSKVHARPFIERVIALIRAGKVDEALALCAEHQSALPDLGLVILRSRSTDETALMHLAEASTLTVVPTLVRRLAWLPALAVASVLLGLCGGIANLHDALIIAATNTVAGQADASLLRGIAYALRPVGAGLLTAVPLVLGHAFVRYESEKLIAQLEEFSVRLVNALVDRPDVRLGHRG
jgi:biopolymer transport protein ExbB